MGILGLDRKQKQAIGGEIGGDLKSLALNPIKQKQNFKWSEKAANNAFDRQMKLYERMYQDKSPKNIVQQLEDAGLSKSLMFGAGAGGVGGAASGTSTPQGAQFSSQAMPGQNLALIAEQMKNLQANTNVAEATVPKVGAETKLIEEQVKAMETQVNKMKAETKNTESQTALNELMGIGQDLINRKAAGTLETDIAAAKTNLAMMNANIDKLLADKELSEESKKNMEEMRTYYQSEIVSEIALNNMKTKVSAAEEANLKELTKTIMPRLQNEFKNTDINMMNSEELRRRVNNEIKQTDLNRYGIEQNLTKDYVTSIAMALSNAIPF